MNKNRFYVTTPIYYVTARPHLGSLYSTLLADIITRWNQIQGKETFLLTGSDEHGQKIAAAAQKANKSPQDFVDSFIPFYQAVWQQYEIKYTRFIRTTERQHIQGAQALVQELITKGDIYKSTYEGWYCVSCETFVTEKSESVKPACSSCGRQTEWITESSYFFKLSKYQQPLLDFYQQHPDFIAPKERLQEVISFVKEGLKDLSISRTTVKWGVPFPQDPQHTIYVWVEALSNYITAIGYGSADQEMFKKWWPANLQILGKDIVRFHAVYWPALLMAAGLPLPRRLLVHGWIKVNEQKMSKSLGNVIDPVELAQHYHVEDIRYFMARYLPISQDAEFSINALEQAIESDLANDLGNLLNRISVLAHKFNCTTLTAPAQHEAHPLFAAQQEMVKEVQLFWKDYQIHLVLARIWKYINQLNSYFHEQQPWKIAKEDRATFEAILYTTAEGLAAVARLLWPILPTKMEALLESLGLPFVQNANIVEQLLQSNSHTFTITVISPLFAKPITDKEKIMENSPQPSQQLTSHEEMYITIEDFTKVEILVGTILECVPLEKSDKLLKMQVDLGPQKGVRQICAGIQKWYKPEDLIGKQALFVANLKPRKMLDTFSQGMMLCAKDEQGKPVPATVSTAVPNGTQLS